MQTASSSLPKSLSKETDLHIKHVFVHEVSGLVDEKSVANNCLSSSCRANTAAMRLAEVLAGCHLCGSNGTCFAKHLKETFCGVSNARLTSVPDLGCVIKEGNPHPPGLPKQLLRDARRAASSHQQPLWLFPAALSWHLSGACSRTQCAACQGRCHGTSRGLQRSRTPSV